MQKKFGQNFLINPRIRKSLIEALGAKPGDDVWEIGPGLGAMTVMLLENKLNVKAFEIDNGFIRVLKNIFSQEENFCLVEGDAMKTCFKEPQAPFLLGNLPYNIAAALLADFIEKKLIFSRMVVTVQKETAQRMAASPGSKDYSSFSVLCASAYIVKPLMVIRKDSFYPQPNVESQGVLLEKKENTEVSEYFFPLVRALFSSRRKTIKNNLSQFLFSRYGNKLSSKTDVQDICASIFNKNGLDGKERAETLCLDVFLSLAKSLENMRL